MDNLSNYDIVFCKRYNKNCKKDINKVDIGKDIKDSYNFGDLHINFDYKEGNSINVQVGIEVDDYDVVSLVLLIEKHY